MATINSIIKCQTYTKSSNIICYEIVKSIDKNLNIINLISEKVHPDYLLIAINVVSATLFIAGIIIYSV